MPESYREGWERHARDWAAWARRPGFDSYWLFNRDAFLELLPPAGRLTLDVGCGEGRLSRDLSARGHRVAGYDGSPTLVGLAREASPELEFTLADAAALPVADGVADLVAAFMVLQDVDDLPGAVAEAFRVLEPGGCLCAAIVHPLNSAGRFTGDAADSPFVIEEGYRDSRGVEDRMERDGLTMTFVGAHHPLETYARALEDAGFVLEALREPRVPDGVMSDDARGRWNRVPMFLHWRARRPA